jgi:hypothetical protein
MAQVTGTIGTEQVELNNAATEATLVAILNTLIRQNQYILSSLKSVNQIVTNTNKGSAGGKGTGAQPTTQAQTQNTQAQNQNTQATMAVVKSLSPLAKTAMVVGGVLGDLAASALKTVGNLTDFAGQMLDGTSKVSGLFTAFKDLPLGLGLVAGLFGKLAEMQEANLTAFRDLTKVGVNFGGDLDKIRLQALAAGLTLTEYSAVVSANSEAIASMGANADKGAMAFNSINKSLTTGGLGKELLSLGYGFKDINELTANYVKVNGGLTEAQKKDYKGVAASVANYGKELDIMARLTGKSREALEKQQEEMTQDVNFKSYLNGLDVKERDNANAALRLAMESGGKGAADALKAKLMGLPPLTEEAQLYLATMKKGSQSIEDFYKIVKNGKSVQENQIALDKVFGQAIAGNIKDLKGFETVLRAGGMSGDKFASTMKGVQEKVILYQQQGKTEEAAITMAISEERKKQIDLSKSGAASAIASEQALKALGAELMGALLPVFKLLTPIINNLAQGFMSFVKDNMPQIRHALQEFADYMDKFVKNMFTEEGRAKIANDIGFYFKLLMIDIKKNVIPWYNEADAARDKKRLEIEKESFDAKATAARTEMENAAKLQALTLSQDTTGAAKEAAEAQLKSAEEQIALLKKKEILTNEETNKLINQENIVSKNKAALDLLNDKENAFNAAAAEKIKRDTEALRADAGRKDLEVEKRKADQKKIDAAESSGQKRGALAGAAGGAAIGLIGGPVGAAVGAVLGGILGALNFGSMAKNEAGAKVDQKNGDAQAGKTVEVQKFATGGLSSGPESGYLAELHGDEIIVPAKGVGEKTSTVEEWLSKFKTSQQNSPSAMLTPDLFSGMSSTISTGNNLINNSLTEILNKLPSLNINSRSISANDTNATADFANKAIADSNTLIKDTMSGFLTKMPSATEIGQAVDQFAKDPGKAITDLTNKIAPNSNDLLKDTMSGFLNKIPTMNDISQAVNQIATTDPKKVIDEFTKTISNFSKNVATKTEIAVDNLTTPWGAINPAQSASNENQIRELQTLNKNMADLLRYVKESAELERQHLSAVKGLQGNLYI